LSLVVIKQEVVATTLLYELIGSKVSVDEQVRTL